MSIMIQHIKEWIENNHLDVQWTSDVVFCLDGKDYLCIDHKEGKIFDEEFNLILSEKERDEILIHRHCFSFGGKVYWSPVLSDKPELNVLKHIGKAKDLSGFPYIGIHGGYELCSGSRSYEDWVKKAKWLGIDTLGICEKSTLAGALKFQKACEEQGIKPIIGETVSVMGRDKSIYQIKVFAVDEVGWQSLLEINRIINVESDQKVISEDTLFIGLPGIIIVIGDTELGHGIVSMYKNAYKDLYFQIDPCQFKAVNRDLQKLENYRIYVKQFYKDIPPILLCDSYYLDQEDSHIRLLLNKIGNVGFDYQSEDQFFKPLEIVFHQLEDMFSSLDIKDEIIEQSISNAYRICAQVEFTIPQGSFKLPQYKMTEDESRLYDNNEDLLWGLLQEGAERKILNNKDENTYIQRLEREVEVIIRGGFVDYFLILHDVVRWCKEQHILTGLGRGSAAGALVSYLLDITKIDPIKYGLLFERFLNEGRMKKGLPDVDTDTPGTRRDEIKRYIESRYGEDNVCSIGTYGKLLIKASMRDLLRIKGVPPQEINYFAAMLSDREDTFHSLFYDMSQSIALKNFLDQHEDVINDIPLLLNQPKNASVHAAGVIITPTYQLETIYNWIPVKKMDGVLISEWEGSELESSGFLKEDILGIKQLDKFADILSLIEKQGKRVPDFESIDYNDENILDLFKQGLNQDVFHFGSVGLTSYSQDVQPDSIEELIAMIALYRPGAMESGSHESYVKIKFGKKDPEYDWGTEEILKSTFGLYVYQEQIMKLCQVLGGLTLVEADDIRRAIGKKDLEAMQRYKKQFIESVVEKGCPIFEANKIWDKIEAFASYSFNRSHAAAYAMTGYFCQYLKYYHPMEFWTISLQYAEEDEISHRINEIRKLGRITITPPDINNSQVVFTSDFNTNTIYWSLGKIKWAGDTAINTIIEEREKNGKFFSIEEFYKRVPKRTVNKRVIENLILAGCFDSIYSISNINQRRLIMAEFFLLLKKDLPEEYRTESEFYWFSKQREISGSGYFDFTKVISISEIPYASQYYLPPDKILLSDNKDSTVVGAGLLIEVIKKKSKRGEFAQLIIDHNNQIMETTLWNESWVIYRRLLEQSIGRAIVVSGRVTADRYKKHNIIHSTDDTIVEIF